MPSSVVFFDVFLFLETIPRNYLKYKFPAESSLPNRKFVIGLLGLNLVQSMAVVTLSNELLDVALVTSKSCRSFCPTVNEKR